MIQFELDKNYNCIICTLSGTLDVSQINNVFQEIYNADWYENTTSELWDFRAVEKIEWEIHEMRELAQAEQNICLVEPGTKSAMVIDNNRIKDDIKMYNMFSKEIGYEVRYFEDYGIALNWIKS